MNSEDPRVKVLFRRLDPEYVLTARPSLTVLRTGGNL
jgi:hypothetical protein